MLAVDLAGLKPSREIPGSRGLAKGSLSGLAEPPEPLTGWGKARGDGGTGMAGGVCGGAKKRARSWGGDWSRATTCHRFVSCSDRDGGGKGAMDNLLVCVFGGSTGSACAGGLIGSGAPVERGEEGKGKVVSGKWKGL